MVLGNALVSLVTFARFSKNLELRDEWVMLKPRAKYDNQPIRFPWAGRARCYLLWSNSVRMNIGGCNHASSSGAGLDSQLFTLRQLFTLQGCYCAEWAGYISVVTRPLVAYPFCLNAASPLPFVQACQSFLWNAFYCHYILVFHIHEPHGSCSSSHISPCYVVL